MKRRKYTKSRRQIAAKRLPKSTLVGKPCFTKTIYPSVEEAEKGATILWSNDASVDRADLHGYECPDGCRVDGQTGFHIGHISYHEKHLEKLGLQNASVSNM